MDARQQLAQAERLGHIIVGSQFQADDFIQLLTLGRQHENGRVAAADAKLPADVIAAETWQHHIQNEQMRTLLCDGVHRQVSALAGGDLEGFAFEHLFQPQRDVRVIFDDQDFRSILAISG